MLKKYSTYVAVLLVIVVIGIGIAIDITNRWNNSKYWTYENVLSTTKNTPATVIRETTDEVEIKFDYGLLHSIQEEGDKIKLSFSYEPYDIYQLRGKDNKNLGTDLSFVIDSKSDSKPSAFLGRLDKSFDSVKALGTYSVVETSGEVKFNYTKPKMELGSLWSHYINAISGKKSSYDVKVTQWYVEDISKLAEKTLSNLTEDKKKDLRKKWREETEKYLVEFYNEEELLSKKYTDKAFLTRVGDAFIFTDVVCLNKNNTFSCANGYSGRPGTNVMMYMYVRNNSGNTQFMEKFVATAKHFLYPFRPTLNLDTEPYEWSNMVTKGYPLCPITDIVKGDFNSNNVELFSMYYNPAVALQKSKYSEKSISELISLNDNIEFEEIPSLPPFIADDNSVSIIQELCYRTIKTQNTDAIKSLKRVYKKLFDGILVRRVTEGGVTSLKRVSFEEFIISSESSYGNLFVPDNVLLQSRLRNIEYKEDQINEKMEIRSMLKTEILLYLYEIY